MPLLYAIVAADAQLVPKLGSDHRVDQPGNDQDADVSSGDAVRCREALVERVADTFERVLGEGVGRITVCVHAGFDRAADQAAQEAAFERLSYCLPDEAL